MWYCSNDELLPEAVVGGLRAHVHRVAIAIRNRGKRERRAKPYITNRNRNLSLEKNTGAKYVAFFSLEASLAGAKSCSL